jgi:hypothetical protein
MRADGRVMKLLGPEVRLLRDRGARRAGCAGRLAVFSGSAGRAWWASGLRVRGGRAGAGGQAAGSARILASAVM